MVGAELQLEAILRGGLRRPHHAGVVDQKIDPWIRRCQILRGSADRAERPKIEFLERTALPSGSAQHQHRLFAHLSRLRF